MFTILSYFVLLIGAPTSALVSFIGSSRIRLI